MDVRQMQRPIRERYRAEPERARITLTARGEAPGAPTACSIDLGRLVQAAEAHAGVGGPGAAACSGDLLLGALAACSQITCQMVAAAMELPVRDISVTVEGDLDLRGTLGVTRTAPVGFETLRMRFAIDAPALDAASLEALREKTHRYCVVWQTLLQPPAITAEGDVTA